MDISLYTRLRRTTMFLHAMGARYLFYKVRSLFIRPRVRLEHRLAAFRGTGLEIGGPSVVFAAGGLFPVYAVATCIDNVTFSNRTRWEGDIRLGQTFRFNPHKTPGTQFVLEGKELVTLPEDHYDFIVSCHMLEHTANPLAALHAWKRLLKIGGHLLLVLPHRDGTFDHRRPITNFMHLQDDYEHKIGENDRTHLAEILELHDLRRDPGQASASDFSKWINDNEVNRGAHHHVFDLHLSIEMVTQVGFAVLAAEAAMPDHIFVLAAKLADPNRVDNQAFLSRDSESYRNSPFRSDRIPGPSRAQPNQ